MKQAKLSDLRRNLSSMLNAVNNDHEPLIVTRRRGKPVVMMSLEDFQAMDRPAPRFATSPSMDRLINSFAEVDEIAFLPHALEDSKKSQ
ncbi:type II toxin-antitoxin system Phd/YefM family antitoxin [uncultured Roseovarius sp.]|uniref:type II toxin-antitoxin system Phd/YefM family antitoxin n=1 Tax=uncultured Roseovarius sp. TaxID=293344 RepID=UPI00260932AC|nr:type II toxin-antitoxin system Phd/YefM family antitoxin [uncultured Roseovarius sp.]